MQTAFEALFAPFDDHLTFEYFKSFRRVRIRFSSPDTTTRARVRLDRFNFDGNQLKVFYAQVGTTVVTRRIVQIMTPGDALLGPPPLEKQFLISPPCSPPVGWAQTHEAPPVFNFDLIARLSVLSEPDEVHELHTGSAGQPTIIVSPCERANDLPCLAAVPRAKIQQTRCPDRD